MEEVHLELSRSNMGYGIIGPDVDHIQGFTMSKAPALATLNEETFAENIDSVDRTENLARDSFLLALARYSAPSPPALVHQ